MKHIFFLFFGVIIIACTSDNEQDYFNLDNECNTDDLYYIASDESRSIAAIIANKCETCHFQGNYNSEVVLETYGQLIDINFGIIGSQSTNPMPPLGAPQLTDCEKLKIESWVSNDFPDEE